jgi:hypothetical protein
MGRCRAVRIFLAAAAAAALALASVALAGQSSPPPQEQQIGLVYVQRAPHGTLTPVRGTPRVGLTLHSAAAHTRALESSPVTQSWRIPTPDFIDSWAGFGFNHAPPNAVLTLLHAQPGADAVALRLRRPHYTNRGRTVHYRAYPIGTAGGNLARFGSRLDPSVPRSFGAASLFIDDASGPVAGGCAPGEVCGSESGCVIQPSTQCPGAQLSGADLSWANLSYANLHGANLSNANLTQALLGDTDLSYANLHGADLSYTYLVSSYMTGADLSDANLSSADLRSAGLYQADLTGADLSNAIFCNTTMPDGSQNNSGC